MKLTSIDMDFLSFAALLKHEFDPFIGQGWWWEGVTDLEA